MGLVKRNASTRKSRMTDKEFQQHKGSFQRQVGLFAYINAVPADLIINWDQTGINAVPSLNYTMEKKEANHVEIAGYGDKRMITSPYANGVWPKD
jgi:hypothetical protein